MNTEKVIVRCPYCHSKMSFSVYSNKKKRWQECVDCPACGYFIEYTVIRNKNKGLHVCDAKQAEAKKNYRAMCPYCHKGLRGKKHDVGFLFEKEDSDDWDMFNKVYWAGEPMKNVNDPYNDSPSSAYTPVIICTDKGMFLATDDNGTNGFMYTRIIFCPMCRRSLSGARGK